MATNPIDTFAQLKTRLVRAQEAQAKAKQDQSAAEALLGQARQEAQEAFGTTDPKALDAMANAAKAEAEGLALEIDQTLTAKGF